MLDQRHHEGVEHDRLLLARKAAFELEKRDIAKRDLADQVVGQVVATDEDAVGGAASQPGLQLAAHFLTVSLVLYPLSPKSDSGTSVTLLRNVSLE